MVNRGVLTDSFAVAKIFHFLKIYFLGLSFAAKARSARGLFSQTVPKSLGAVSHSLWNSVRSGPSPLLLHHNIIS
jgi:hypothetical protein